MENLKKVKNGFRGDGRAKLRKRLHYWNFKSLLSKIDRVAKLRGVEAIKVNPAYTSVIGALKYVPQLGIDKDIAGAYVVLPMLGEFFVRDFSEMAKAGKSVSSRSVCGGNTWAHWVINWTKPIPKT